MMIVKVLLPTKISAESKVLIHSEDNEVVRSGRISGVLLARLHGRRWAYFRATVSGDVIELDVEVFPNPRW